VIITRGAMPCFLSSFRSRRLAAWALRRLCLNQDVEHDAVLIDGAPQPMLPARDADHDLV
jgi:hypothetical protein